MENLLVASVVPSDLVPSIYAIILPIFLVVDISFLVLARSNFHIDREVIFYDSLFYLCTHSY